MKSFKLGRIRLHLKNLIKVKILKYANICV